MPTLINGQSDNQLSASDRGLAYGDGLFETIEFKDGNLVYWNEHMERLSEGCVRLKMADVNSDLLLEDCLKLTTGKSSGIVKIMVTRSEGGRGYRPSLSSGLHRIVSFHSSPEIPPHYYREGIRLARCKTPVSINPMLAGLKSLCRLEQVMAQMEWSESDYAEGLMLSPDEHVIEGSKTNVFIVQDGELLTPLLEQCGVNGIMRQQVIKFARQSAVTVRECNILHAQFIDAEEIFVCNSLIKIWPVRHYLKRRYPIGPIARMMMTEFL